MQDTELRNETMRYMPGNISKMNGSFSETQIPDLTLLVLAQVYRISLVYVVPVVIIIGLTGNIVSFLVFMYSYLRRLSSSTYLVALSLADFMFLVCAGVSWLNMVGIHWYHKAVLCHIFVFLTYVCSFLSVWFTVGFSAERYIAVCMPLHRQEMCTKRRARKVVGLLVTIAVMFYSTTLWTTTTTLNNGSSVCSIRKQYFRWVNIMNNIDTIVTLVIPVLTIVILNSVIMKTVYLFYKNHHESQTQYLRRLVLGVRNIGTKFAGYRRRSDTNQETDNEYHNMTGPRESLMKESEENVQISFLTSETRSRNIDRKVSNALSTTTTTTTSTSNDIRPRNLGRTTLSQVRVTKMLLLVSSAFVVLNLPSHAMRLYMFIGFIQQENFQPTYKVGILMKLFEHLYYVNFACNVFLYSASGRNFRFACRQLWGRIRYNLSKLFQSCFKPCSSCCMKNKETQSNSRLRN